METNKSNNAKRSQSSLLLHLPQTLSGMSGNSFLMPVAIDKSEDVQKSVPPVSSSSKYEGTQQVISTSSVCQLEQPLLMRKTSTPEVSTQSFQNAPNAEFLPGKTETLVHTVDPNEKIPASLSIPPSELLVQSSSLSTGYNAENPLVYTEYPSPFMTSIPLNTESITSLGSASTDVTTSPFSQDEPCGSHIGVAPPVYSESLVGEQKSILTNIPPNSAQTEPCVKPKKPWGQYLGYYEPLKPHWLFCKVIETKEVWYGFSGKDSERLESAFQKDEKAVVPVDGGRYDAFLAERVKRPIYFNAPDIPIRRATWFYQAYATLQFLPYEESIANLIEEHYYKCVTLVQWYEQVHIPGAGIIVVENPRVIYCYKSTDRMSSTDPKSFTTTLVRGMPRILEFVRDEADQIDHLVFIVQGIGSFCDLRFRTVVECVDGFRDIANTLLKSNFNLKVDQGHEGRVEFLPVAWHAKLHRNDVGVDRHMQKITLPSIPKLRHFTNDTLLDILLYSSPSYCQTIIDTVAYELNKIYDVFLSRNPGFMGRVYVAGHSLGSLILFDILANQKLGEDCKLQNRKLSKAEHKESFADVENNRAEPIFGDGVVTETFSSIEGLMESLHLEEYNELFMKEKIDLATLPMLAENDIKNLGLPIGPCKKLRHALKSQKSANIYMSKMPQWQGEPFLHTQTAANEGILDKNVEVPKCTAVTYPMKAEDCSLSTTVYPSLCFKPSGFFALGSPIAMFLTVRGYDSISSDFKFPTCPAFFHIFHPYDPVAYRIEPLIDPNFLAKPFLIPHHRGRKRLHLELRDNFAKVGYEIKQKFMDTLRFTWNSLSGLAISRAFPADAVEAEVDKLVQQQMSESVDDTQGRSSSSPEISSEEDASGEEICIGCLNGGRRIDYVLQEKPIEALNDYIFALTSHSTYWDSEDTAFMILREIYALDDVYPLPGFRERKRSGSRSPIKALSGCSDSSETEGNMKGSENVLYGSESNMKGTENLSYGFFANQNIPVVPVSAENTISSESKGSASSLQTSVLPPPQVQTFQQLGPPPLSGFVKRSPFAK